MYRTAIFPVVLYGCETWFLTMGQEHRLRVFEYWVLSGVFGTKRKDVKGYWRENCIKSGFRVCMQVMGHVASMEREEIFVGGNCRKDATCNI
jgi:hypothetical protein